MQHCTDQSKVLNERDTQPGSACTEPTLDGLIPVFDSDTGALLHDL